MNKKKVLWDGEASWLSTGYAVYGQELLSRLVQQEDLEIAELASYGGDDDPRKGLFPWKIYGNLPVNNAPQHVKNAYDASAINEFGAFRFEEVCIDFSPNYVLNIRDFWMFNFELRSPFRPYFRHICMPTVDAKPQQDEWLDAFGNSDLVLTYTDWSGDVLKSQSSPGQINYFGTATPVAEDCFKPVTDKKAHRRNFKIDENAIIVGTVMRNQRRKLFPDLFKAFRKFLDETQANVYLYCHTSYPDNNSWDIPNLLKEYKLSSRVLFTYICPERGCGYAYPSLFADACCVCPNCEAPNTILCNSTTGVDSEGLAQIYNLFDLYVQYANSEGLGIPMVEAASCGVPIAAVDYSGMADVLEKVGGYKITPKTYTKEMETGCFRAIPDEEVFINILKEFTALPESLRVIKGHQSRANLLANYGNWDDVADVWVKAINSLSVIPDEVSWKSPVKIFTPSERIPPMNIQNKDYVRWLITDVWCEPQKLDSFIEAKLLRDLNYGKCLSTLSSPMFDDLAYKFSKPEYQDFNREIAYNYVRGLAEKRNRLEYARGKKFGLI